MPAGVRPAQRSAGNVAAMASDEPSSTAPGLADVTETWPVVRSEDLHRDHWVVALRADFLHAPDQPEPVFRRLVMENPGAVMVLAIDEDDRVVVLRQYRHPVARRVLQLPAGLLDVAGEDPVVAAQRELVEETGLEADRWEHLITTWPSPGISEEAHAIYVARGLREVGRGDFEAEAEEADMSVERVPYDDLLDAVLDGRVHDGSMALAMTAYDAARRRSARE